MSLHGRDHHTGAAIRPCYSAITAKKTCPSKESSQSPDQSRSPKVTFTLTFALLMPPGGTIAEMSIWPR